MVSTREIRGLFAIAIVLGLGLLVFTFRSSIFEQANRPVSETWCPNESVTVTEIVAKNNYSGVTVELDHGKPNEAFKTLPFVKLYSTEYDKPYEGFVFNSPDDVTLKELEYLVKTKTPICVTHARIGVFLLYKPINLNQKSGGKK